MRWFLPPFLSGADDGWSSTELMLFNSVLSLPFLGLFILGTGELSISVPELTAKTRSRSATQQVADGVDELLFHGDYVSSNGHCVQLYHVSLHHRQLCANHDYSWRAQGRWLNDSGHSSGGNGGPCVERYGASYQHLGWHLLFFCQISGEGKKKVAFRPQTFVLRDLNFRMRKCSERKEQIGEPRVSASPLSARP
ncbi:hypothetical protein R1flu_024019 [Riccia fluitans]|uniref:Uncharacterized protein n=1 Tax=Riccia fluitans TaxID=41844 RepID=A0ABD1XTV6_9MARC